MCKIHRYKSLENIALYTYVSKNTYIYIQYIKRLEYCFVYVRKNTYIQYIKRLLWKSMLYIKEKNFMLCDFASKA